MKIAYIILAHKNIPQLKRLLRTLEDNRVSIYLHLDKGAGKSFYQQAKAELAEINNLFLLKRYFTNWGSFGLVDATLEGMQQAMRNGDSDYIILLSGQDFPVRSTPELFSFLESSGGKSFIECHPFPVPHWHDNGGFDRIQKWNLSLPIKYTARGKILRARLNQTMNILFPRRNFPKGFTPFGGSQWWCLHRDCVKYILEFYRQQKKFVRFFKTIRIPDEIFFHTILSNSPLLSKLENRTLTYVDWNGPPYPRYLTAIDLKKIKKSDHYFARKIDWDLTIGLVDGVEG